MATDAPLAAVPPDHASVSVTVVIPAYQQAHYVGESVASALAQRAEVQRVALDVVVVDDGSPDDVTGGARRLRGRARAVWCGRQTPGCARRAIAASPNPGASG